MSAVRCPVCEGRGVVANGFYLTTITTNATPERCRSCGGRGYVVVDISSYRLTRPFDSDFPVPLPEQGGGS